MFSMGIVVLNDLKTRITSLSSSVKPNVSLKTMRPRL